MDLNAAELRLLAHLAAQEGRAHQGDMEMRKTHQAARAYAKKRGVPVQGVCPTMVRDYSVLDEDYTEPAIDAAALAERLKAEAIVLEQGGPYR